MNIENREEMLKESKSVICIVDPILKSKGLTDEAILNLKEILELCVHYGFDQGVIHGMFKGQMESCNKLAELMAIKDNG